MRLTLIPVILLAAAPGTLSSKTSRRGANPFAGLIPVSGAIPNDAASFFNDAGKCPFFPTFLPSPNVSSITGSGSGLSGLFLQFEKTFTGSASSFCSQMSSGSGNLPDFESLLSKYGFSPTSGSTPDFSTLQSEISKFFCSSSSTTSGSGMGSGLSGFQNLLSQFGFTGGTGSLPSGGSSLSGLYSDFQKLFSSSSNAFSTSSGSSNGLSQITSLLSKYGFPSSGCSACSGSGLSQFASALSTFFGGNHPSTGTGNGLSGLSAILSKFGMFSTSSPSLPGLFIPGLGPEVENGLSSSSLRRRRNKIVTRQSIGLNITIPEFVYVVQCTEVGFLGDCLVFASPLGQCGMYYSLPFKHSLLAKSVLTALLSVSYFDYQSGNDTSISDTYNDKVNSLSTNTGGACQFYE